MKIRNLMKNEHRESYDSTAIDSSTALDLSMPTILVRRFVDFESEEMMRLSGKFWTTSFVGRDGDLLIASFFF